jgi:hypothetical protein
MIVLQTTTAVSASIQTVTKQKMVALLRTPLFHAAVLMPHDRTDGARPNRQRGCQKLNGAILTRMTIRA